MSELIIQKSTLVEIGDAVRAMRETTDEIPVKNLAAEILAIQSGAELNFAVVAFDPEAGFPETAEENTFAVITSTPINGFAFSATEPGVPEPGSVWITTGAASPVAFNALKEGTIMVYPLSAKQYVDGAWVEKSVKIFKNGVWVEWVTFLYNYGDECESISGGWTAMSYAGNAQLTGQAPTITRHDDYMDISLSAAMSGGLAIHKEKVGLKEFSTVTIEVSNVVKTSSYSVITLGITDGTNMLASRTITAGGTYSLDVSTLNDSYYVDIHLANVEGTTSVRMHGIKLS